MRSKASVPNSLLTFFSASAPYLKQFSTRVMLFMDHSDVIHELPYEERRAFVEAMINISNNRDRFCLYVVGIIGNSVVRAFSIRDEEQNRMISPFDTHLFASPFTLDEFIHFTKSYLTNSITLDIVEKIYKRYTFGHIGQSVLMLKYFEKLSEEYPVSNVEEWEDQILTNEFWDYIKQDEFHSKIFEGLSNDKLMEPLINWLKHSREGRSLSLDLTIEDELARLGLIQLSVKRFYITSLLMQDLVEIIYTNPPQL